jgi:hypothetical protein
MVSVVSAEAVEARAARLIAPKMPANRDFMWSSRSIEQLFAHC